MSQVLACSLSLRNSSLTIITSNNQTKQNTAMVWPFSSSSTPSKPDQQTVHNATAETVKKVANTTKDLDPSTKLPEPKRLPAELQKIVDKADKDENFFDELYEG